MCQPASEGLCEWAGAQCGGRLLGMHLAHKQMASLTETAEGLLLRRYRGTDHEGAHCHAVFTERPDV